ncbi:MAG: polyribonucleotide nucleotidyltransferase [bacterium]
MNEIHSFSIQIGDREVTVETGRVARSAGGAVLIKTGDTVIMVNATASEEPRPGIDFFPLTVDFEERMYAVGRIPGSFHRKEGRPSEKAILTSRLIDRPIRPLFPKGYRKDVQIVTSVLSSDASVQPDTLAIFGASCALELAGIPFQGPIGAVRLGKIDGQFIVNPTYQQSEQSDLDIVVAGVEDSVMMIEAGCDFVAEEEILAAIEFAMGEIKKQVQAQREFIQKLGIVKQDFVDPFDTTELNNIISEVAKNLVTEAYHDFDRDGRKQKLKAAKEAVVQKISELEETHPVKLLLASSPINFVGEGFKSLEKEVMRNIVLSESVRADGRKLDEVRPITCEVGLLPRAHGSALFTRGSTQVLSVATLGSPGDAQCIDGLDPQTEKRYLHHYAFPGYSVGEPRPIRAAGRREVGHGALAERAILPSLPSKDKFPYVIRVNSDVLESNGSTSMGSTCGSSLALMDAGVPVSAMVGGVAMGLIQEADRVAVLTDIQGIEDFLGDMDFKVTGNTEAITALQMDIKIKGISFETLKAAIEQARKGRIHIIDKMMEAITEPREALSNYAPRIDTMKIDVESIGAVIGPGGKTIRGIIEATGAKIDIEDNGTVTIASIEQDGGLRARKMIEALTFKLTEGLVAKGKVVRIIPIGAFVEVVPGKDGLVHISQISKERVAKVEDVLNVGDEVFIKVMAVDEKGRVNLTIKGVTDEEKATLG